MKTFRKLNILFFFATIGNTCFAQYYYKDVLSNVIITADMILYKEMNIHQIKISSFEENGEPSKHFLCEKKIAKDFKKTTLYTKTGIAGKSILITNYNDKLQVTSTYDSSDNSVSQSQFSYDSKDRIIKISSLSKSADEDFVNLIKEDHIYEYEREERIPNKMIKIKNDTDTTVVLFSTDENNNISIEKDTKTAAKYYYYYDKKNQLTDVVHSNEYNENMIADYIFEYDNLKRLTRLTTTEEGSSNYLVWLYEYDGKLRKKEKVYSKGGVFIGRIEYEYK